MDSLAPVIQSPDLCGLRTFAEDVAMIRLTCPNCDKNLTVDDAHADRVGKCPACNGTISVPGAPQLHVSSDPERVEDDPLQASKRVPKPKPVRPAPLTLPTTKEPADERKPIGNDVPTPSRQSARDPITRAPAARPQPRLTAEEDLSREEEVAEAEPSRKRRKKKKSAGESPAWASPRAW
jgi:hypothetical protein